MSKYNPWRGLAAYKDPSTSEHTYEFCGRDAETIQLVNLIENNLFVTLYGRTGVGKTSLLNAGVIPNLRKRNFYPIYIRLSQENGDISYAQAIVNKIESEENLIKEKLVENDNNGNNDGKSKTFLWKYFCTTKFKIKINDESPDIYPVIILDQFEEVFFTKREKAKLLLQQIYALLSDDLAIPEGYSDETNYRFVASIREDNLFYLEDCIDELSLNLYKDNRYRLKPLNADNAKKAILEPGDNIINKEEAEQIADRIIDISKDKDRSISSLILSLICSLMYEQAKKLNHEQPVITLQQIPVTQNDTDIILADFYLNNTTKKQRKAIEENLLTDDGHRKAAEVNIPERESLLSSGNRILQKIETNEGEKVEIVHDRMAKVIYRQRRRRDTNRFRNLFRVVILVLLVVIGGIAMYLSTTTTNGSYVTFAFRIVKDPVLKFPEKVKTLTDTIVKKDTITRYSDIEKVIIGESVESIDSLYWWKDSLEIVVSPGNKHFRWDTVFTAEGHIGYLYDVKEPTTAIYMQRMPERREPFIRLPKGVDTLKYKDRTIIMSDGLPHYGEKHIKASLYEDKLDDGLFYNDNRIESVDFSGVKNVPYSAFRNCSNLRSVNLDSVENINNFAFAECKSLKDVSLPEDEIGIGTGVFSGCTNLETIRLPKILKGDGSSMFKCCYSLKEIVLPDEVGYIPAPGDGYFEMCLNIENVRFHSANTHFRYDKDSVLCYDSIPVLFNKCVTSEWISADSLYRINSGIVVYDKENGGKELCTLVDFREWDKFKGIYYKRMDEKQTFIWFDDLDSTLYLPVGSVQYILAPDHEIREIHTPVVDPDNFLIIYYNTDYKIKKEDITLYVPWNTRDEYLRNVEYLGYKEIREDPLYKRVTDILGYYLSGIISTFGRFGWIFYPLIIVGLGILTAFFYWLRVKQMKRYGRINRRKALLDAILGIPIAVIGFVPVYYVIYVYLMNHVEYSRDMNVLGMWLGSAMGIISSALCSYLFIFSGKGKMWRSLRRMTKHKDV